MRLADMKKAVIIAILVLAGAAYTYRYGCKSLFVPTVMQKIKGNGIDTLKEKAAEAENNYRDEIEKAEKAGTAFEKLGKKYLEMKDWTPAIESLEKAVSYGRAVSNVHYSLGVAYANRAKALDGPKDAEKAEFHYRRAIELSPNLSNAYYGLGILQFYMRDQKKEGLKTMKKLVEKEPDHYRARFALARFYYEMDNPSASLDTYQKLHDDLKIKQDSSIIMEYRKQCDENITRLMSEMTRKK